MTRMSNAREEEIRDAVTSGNENAGRLRLESMCADVLDELDATRADLGRLRLLATEVAMCCPSRDEYDDAEDQRAGDAAMRALRLWLEGVK